MRGLVILLSVTCLSTTLSAQVFAPTVEDEAKVPAAFSARNTEGPGAFAPRSTPQGYTPNPDPKDFTGSYVTGGGGPPAGLPPAGDAAGGPPPAVPGGMAAGVNAGSRESCVPSFGSGAYATHLVSSSGRLTVIGEENHRLRRIEIGAAHPDNVAATYAADSVARWEGNTLVVDTIAIRGQQDAHLLERWTRQPDGSIDIQTSRLDASGKPQSTRSSKLVWRPDITYVENICEDFGEAFGATYRQKLAK